MTAPAAPPSPTPPADYTPASAMSLRELRAEMLTNAASIAAKAGRARRRGDIPGARALEQKARHLVQIAKSVKVE